MSGKTPFLQRPTMQRLVLSIVGIVLIQISWRWAVAHLYSLPTMALAGFVSITTSAFYVIGAIVIFMVTGKLVYDWKMGTNQVQEVASRAEDLKEEIIERVVKPKYFDDDSIP
jgi:hypothetical protein